MPSLDRPEILACKEKIVSLTRRVLQLGLWRLRGRASQMSFKFFQTMSACYMSCISTIVITIPTFYLVSFGELDTKFKEIGMVDMHRRIG